MKTWLRTIFVLSIILIIASVIIPLVISNNLPGGESKGYFMTGIFLLIFPIGILLLLVSIIFYLISKFKKKKKK